LPTVDSGQEPPEGYYAFIEAPRMEPPQVRSPPYFKSNKLCPGKNYTLIIVIIYNLILVIPVA